MNLPDAAVVAQQMAKAIAEKDRCLTAWQRYECRAVTDAHIRDADLHLQRLREQLTSLDDSVYRERSTQLVFDSIRSGLARLLWLDSLDWFCASILIALPAFAVPVVVLAIAKAGIWYVFGLASVDYLFISLVVAVNLHALDHSVFADKKKELTDWVADRRKLIAETTASVSEARTRLSELKLIRHCQEEHESACQEVLRLRKIKDSRLYALMNVDWRTLRGIPFEEFLADIFSELGFSVETTKTSGDQGVDLLITGRGRRIAVQAKGYAESVGNSAVQQAYAGMAFYGCDGCMVVTNSNFTSSAHELAQKIHCRLVDGSQISDLIQGRIISNEVSNAPNSPSAAGSGR